MKTRLLKYILPLLFVCLIGERAYSAVSITVTALTGGLTPNPIVGGQNGIVVLGFALTVSGNTSPYTIAQFNFKHVNNAQSLFTNGQLYRANSVSTTTYSSTTGFTQVASSAISGTTVNIYDTYTQVFGINEVFATGGETKNYFFVVDFTGLNYVTNTIQYLINTTTNPSFSYGPSYSNPMNPLTGISGINYTVGRTLDWRAQQPSTDASDYRNYSTSNNGQATSAITASDVLRFGVKNSYNPSVTPILNSNLSVYQMVFDGTNAINLTINSGVTLNIANGITAQNSAASSIVGPLTGTAPIINVGGVSSIASGSSLSLTNLTTFTNTGTLNQNGTFSAAGVVSNSGTINHSGTGALTFGSTLNNTGTISQTGTGSVSVTGAITNNSPGSIVLGGGAGIFNANYSGSGSLNLGTAGVKDFNGTFSNSGTVTQAGSTVQIAGNFTNTNPGTFISSSGLVNFDGAAQTLNNTNTTANPAVLFNNVTFSGGNIKNMSASSGTFKVSSKGVLTMAASTTLNTGVAKLTLNSDANGTANVAAVPSTAGVTGTVITERFIQGGAASTYRRYRLMSSPVYTTTGATASDNTHTYANLILNSPVTGPSPGTNGFDASALNSYTIYTYNESPATSSLDYTGVSPITQTLKVGNGFYFYFRGDRSNASNATGNKFVAPFANPENTTETWIGTLNQQQIIKSVNYTARYSSGTTYDVNNGFNLLGNPYPSTIDLSALVYSSNISNTIYVYNYHSGNFETYNRSTQVTSPNGQAYLRYVTPGQGFFVKLNNPSGTPAAGNVTTGTVTFNESSKSTSSNYTGLNLLLGEKPKENIFPLIQVKLEMDTTNYDYATVVFKDGYTANYDNDDAIRLGGLDSKTALGSLSGEKRVLSVNYMPDISKVKEVGLSVSASTTGIYSLKFSNHENIDNRYSIYLKDKYKKDSLDVRHNGIYNFNLNRSDTASYGLNRFSLVIRKNPDLDPKLLDFSAAKVTGGGELSWIAEGESNYLYYTVERSIDNGKTFDLLGGFTSSGLGKYTLLDNYPVNGLNQYRLKQDDDGIIKYSKIVTLMYSSFANNVITNNINVYPNPAGAVVNVAVALQDNTVSYNIRVTDGVGTLVRSAVSTQPTWQDNIGNLKPGTYFVQVINNNKKTVVGTGKFIKN